MKAGRAVIKGEGQAAKYKAGKEGQGQWTGKVYKGR